jgi:putative ABC transport system ATP-binding protein
MVIVTHDPVAAAYADRVVFLADGRIVDELYEPTADTVLDGILRLSMGNAHNPGFGTEGRAR